MQKFASKLQRAQLAACLLALRLSGLKDERSGKGQVLRGNCAASLKGGNLFRYYGIQEF